MRTMKTKNLKLIAILFTTIIFACNRTDFSNPEDVLKHYCELADKNENGKLYDDYLSSNSKEFVTKDEFIKSAMLADSTLMKFKIIDKKISAYPVDVNKPTYRRYKEEKTYLYKNDTTNKIKARWYYTLINENGNWKVIWTNTLLSFAVQKSFDGNYSEARKTLEKIIEINPFNGDAYDALASAYYRDESLPPNEKENGIVKNAKYALTLEEDISTHYNTISTYYINIGNRFQI